MRRTPLPRSIKSRGSRGRLSRQREDQDDEIPEVYREMLAEAEARNPNGLEDDRPIKKRKLGEQRDVSSGSQPANQEAHPAEINDDVGRRVQTVYDSSTPDESDMEWEDVEIQEAPSQLMKTAPFSRADDEPMQITIDQHKDTGRKVVSRRKPVSAAEKRLRLDVHKVHLLCLLRHAQIRNLWCNDDELQSFLKRMLSRQMISMLNPSEDKPQYSRSTTFIDGLNQASDAFSRRFRVTKPGIKRSHWADDSDSINYKAELIMSGAEVFLSKEDFRRQAKTLQGSRDFGAQLFCALLRSAAVEARLVCSLQPLPFSGTTKNMTPVKPSSQYIVISSDDCETSTDDQNKSGTSPVTPLRTRRLGRPQFTPTRFPKISLNNPRPNVRDSPYPVFWVEAFNEAVQKWIPVDPLVTKSLAKPSKFEPPSSDPNNCMSYVVGFEEDASARDVTRRYAKAFNAKTRKLRVESTKHGEQCWAMIMKFYEKPFLEDRDEVEVSELTAKTAAEPMPRNVQDFKDHPIYALERQLRRNEVVFPKRVIGQVSLGKSGSKNQILEPVYRRSDVHIVRSADRWYRLGRDIKMGEQPLKRVRASKNKVSVFNEEEEDEGAIETPLYAYFQTELYKPPPVVQGKIPKNVYGNLDVYVPSMVPPGGVHIKHSDAVHAAKILGIDYADAVTGFDFKGRHGTAIIQGIIIASEYREALEEVLECLQDERRQALLEEKSAEMLHLWKHLLLRLRIAERVNAYAIEGEDADDESADVSEGEDDPEETGGGFFPETGQETTYEYSESNRRNFTEEKFSQAHLITEDNIAHVPGEDEFLGGGFIPDEPTDNTGTTDSSTLNATGIKDSTTKPPRYRLVVVPDDEGKRVGDIDSKHTTSKLSEAVGLDSEAEVGDPEDGIPNDLAGSSEAPIEVESSAAGGSKSASVEIISRAASQTQSQAQSPGATGEESEANDDGSLLSQDPEDEDAIPEWLM